MKTVVKMAVLLLSLNVYLFAQQPLASWRGVYLGIRDSINSRQLADTLGMNIIEFNSGRNSNPGVEDSVLKNGAGLRVINQRKLFEGYTAGQHMEFQAERQSNPLFSHFENRIGVISQLDPAAWWCRPGIEPTGYMVQTAVPDSEYNYGQTNYQATFLIKLGVWSGIHPAVRCDVVCKTTGDVFATATYNSSDFVPGVYKEITLPFSLNYIPLGPVQQVPVGRLSMGFVPGGWSATMSPTNVCQRIDLRVYWYGNDTTYLDKVTVEDGTGHELFKGTYDSGINGEAVTYGNGVDYPLHEKFYLMDEPELSSFLPFNYVGNKINSSLGYTWRAGSVTAMYKYFERFLIDATPDRLMIDPYMFTADIPHPSITDTNVANAAGIEHWNGDTYLTAIQARIDQTVQNSIAPAAGLAVNPSYNRVLITIPQLHGIMSNSQLKYRHVAGGASLRPPSPSELRMEYGLDMAYGAKGFLAFALDTWRGVFDGDLVAMPGLVSIVPSGGRYMNHWDNFATLFGKYIWTGYKEKWDEVSALNNRLKLVGDTLTAFTWIGSKSWSNTLIPWGNWSNSVVAGVSTKDTMGSVDQTPYVEIGQLQRNSTTDYIVVVNRRCADNAINRDTRDISITFGSKYSNWLVTDVESKSSWVVKLGAPFTNRFRPGDWRIYRLENATLTANRVFPSLRFVGGGLLTLGSGVSATSRGSMDTVNALLGSNALFTADSGSSMVIARDSAFIFGAGASVRVLGTVNISPNIFSWKIGSNGTLRIFYPATVQFIGNSFLEVHGKLIATGAAAGNTVIFRGGTLEMYGGPDSLTYCSLKAMNFGSVISGSLTHTLLRCRFDSCMVGMQISLTPLTSNTVTVKNSRFSACQWPIDLLSSARIYLEADTLSSGSSISYPAIESHGSTVYLKQCVVSDNPGLGFSVMTTPGFIYATPDGTTRGDNFVERNGGGQIKSSSGGGVFIGQRQSGGQVYGGYNTISGNITG